MQWLTIKLNTVREKLYSQKTVIINQKTFIVFFVGSFSAFFWGSEIFLAEEPAKFRSTHIGIRRLVCPRGRAHLESEYEFVYSGTWVELFLYFNRYFIYQEVKYAEMFVVILRNVQRNNFSVAEYDKYRYYVTGNFVDKSLVISGLMISVVQDGFYNVSILFF